MTTEILSGTLDNIPVIIVAEKGKRGPLKVTVYNDCGVAFRGNRALVKQVAKVLREAA